MQIIANNSTCDIHPLQSGCSAVYKGNYPVFYVTHGVAMVQIFISIIASVIVIASIGKRFKEFSNARGRFSDRFPFYIAVCDLMWGVSHFIDHLILLVTETYPGWVVVFIISRLNYFCMGYQQLLYGGVAVYTYLKIVRETQFQLGRWEWKLHGLCFLIVGTVTAVNSFTGVLGISRYWLLQNESHPNWKIPHYVNTALTTFQALSTIFTYYAIKKKVLSSRSDLSTMEANKSSANSYHETASSCLTTFVMLGIVLYLPLAFYTWLFVIGVVFDLNLIDLLSLSPSAITARLCLVVLVNAGGFGNAIAYFYNQHLKNDRLSKLQRGGHASTVRTTNTSLAVSLSEIEPSQTK